MPSFFSGQLPLPPFTDTRSPKSEQTTPLGLACVMPPHYHKPYIGSPLDQYLHETRVQAPRSKVLLWPEAAVHFEWKEAKEAALLEVEKIANQSKVWIGVSYTEPDLNPPVGGGHRDGLRKNGMVLIGPDGKVFEYFKRNLVPIAESYNMQPSREPLPFYEIPLPAPPRTPHQDWPEKARHIPVTASICLDFSQPLPGLPAHAALILAPARTWHPAIGHSMAQAAAARADEIGAAVLWCDGGSGGLSGVFGYGTGPGLQISQRGNGASVVKYLGVPYPFEPRKNTRTMYAVFGDFGAAFLIWGLVGAGWFTEAGNKKVSMKKIVASVKGGTSAGYAHSQRFVYHTWSKVTGKAITHDVEAAPERVRQAVGVLVDTSD